jgi:hypothetical protein
VNIPAPARPFWKSLSIALLLVIIHRFETRRMSPRRLVRALPFNHLSAGGRAMSTQTEAAKGTAAGANDNGAKPKPPARKLIALEKLKPNADQARQTWGTGKDEEGRSALDRLAESIRQNGLLNDLIVTPEGDHYLIVCGERRYRAIRNHKLMAELPENGRIGRGRLKPATDGRGRCQTPADEPRAVPPAPFPGADSAAHSALTTRRPLAPEGAGSLDQGRMLVAQCQRAISSVLTLSQPLVSWCRRTRIG